MALLFLSKVDPADWWREELVARLPDLEVRIWPEVGDVAGIEYALAWKPKPGELARYPNLKAIFSLGAGVDHLFGDPDLPRDVPVCRVVDERLTAGMVEYALLHVLRYHRREPEYAEQQRRRVWRQLEQVSAGERSVGVMGLGVIGGEVARRLAELGFAVAGWSRTARSLPGIACFHGADGLEPFLARSLIVVCLLPLTPETEDILCRRTFAAMPRGGYLINAARGAHLVEDELLAALEAGQLAGATLDVTREEPLPREHPFWRHPRVTITPHIASITDPRTVADQVAENVRRARAGAPLLNVV
ncbi:MAG: 2-hydroxyacid dehydrogenase, partial [Alphaproteobacteria bacterium]